MKHNFNSNHKEEISVSQNTQLINELLSNLNSFAEEKAEFKKNLPELICPQVKLNIVPEKALYITEINGNFCLLDYRFEGQKPEPMSLDSNNLSKTQQLAESTTEISAKLLANKNISSDSSFLLGKKSLLLGMGLGIILTLGAFRFFLAPTASKGVDSDLANVTETVAPAQAVTITKIITTDIDSTLDAFGTVAAYERTPVMSQANGLQITEILSERGDFVNRGQVLARLNNSVLVAEKVEAEGAVAQAQARLDELQAGSRVEEIAQAEARVANAKSEIAQTESNLELVKKRVERNRTLQVEGAITRDRLDEVLNQEQVTQSDLAGAKARLKEAQEALAQLKAGSRPQIIAQAQAELAQAKGRLQRIEAQLADTVVVAPSSGIIASRDAQVGQITSSSEMLFSIIQNGRLELRLRVPETLIGKIMPGQKVQITSNALQNLNLTGKVREIDPLIDDSSRQALVKVDLPGGTNLKPGMFLKAAINTNTSQGQAVPIEALLPQSENQAIAFVLQNDNTVKAQTVEMGEILAGQKVEILSGLQLGDLIVLKGAAYLKDGDLVTVSNGEV
ncbi:efflux RND transporter periplasmic adaptor subunit [Pleurocapsa sp. PCC 7319]|uniref:efflux RND transporter periplasmic adaptor subunit n=1 Tax=Pleurocapsa sp. PCC 7319 TaxID=118161 RepID=UPI000344F374|nr:efflux RND transporter periplasmic adaptor subunit [Pleurocapsa sp. PCC 7319]